MAQTFTDLHIRTDGVGDYDLNRFRIVFRSSTADAQTLAGRLINGFPGYFAGSAATVERPQADKLKFHGNMPFGKIYLNTPHADWVRVVNTDPTRSFTVTTLHREYEEPEEEVAKRAATTNPALELAVMAAVRANKYHFLAGRRAWRVDTSRTSRLMGDATRYPDDAIVLETAAIERFSLREMLPIKPVLRSTVVEIWCNLLTKFVAQDGIKVLDSSEWPLETGWIAHGTVHRYVHQFGNDGALTASPEFRELTRLYPRIYEAASGH